MVQIPYRVGALYNRRNEIHGRYGGQRQGGISTPQDQPFIILFTGVGGEEHGYLDHWDPQGYFHYFGEGQLGDMSYVRGNAAIRSHRHEGKRLLVFQMLGHGKPCRYFGEFELVDTYLSGGIPDRNGEMRTAIVFKLRPLDQGELPFENTIHKPTPAEIEIGSTVALRLTKVRSKQDFFRRQLVGIEKACRITGIADLRFLRASHIRPWADCETGDQRVDGNNGLLMAPHVDLLFDRGWISFEDSGSLLRSGELSDQIVKGLGLKLKNRGVYGNFSEAQRSYLEFHRQAVFEKKFKRARDPVEDLLQVIASVG